VSVKIKGNIGWREEHKQPNVCLRPYIFIYGTSKISWFRIPSGAASPYHVMNPLGSRKKHGHPTLHQFHMKYAWEKENRLSGFSNPQK